MPKVTKAAIKDCIKKWKALYGSAVGSDFTVECGTCEALLIGEKPSIVITCLHCFAKKFSISKKAINAYLKEVTR